jgi:hypothetical protein
LTRIYLGRVYGDKVRITYHDAASPQVREQFSEVLEMAEDRYWPPPLVLIDDRVVMAGEVDAYRIAAWVNQALDES